MPGIIDRMGRIARRRARKPGAFAASKENKPKPRQTSEKPVPNARVAPRSKFRKNDDEEDA